MTETDRSGEFNVVEYAVRSMFKGKSVKSAAVFTAKKLSGVENFFLGPGITIVDPVKLEAAIWQRMVEYVLKALPKIRPGKEHYALEGTVQFYKQPPRARIKLKQLVVEKLGCDPFSGDDYCEVLPR